jgi:hypothetical protein
MMAMTNLLQKFDQPPPEQLQGGTAHSNDAHRDLSRRRFLQSAALAGASAAIPAGAAVSPSSGAVSAQTPKMQSAALACRFPFSAWADITLAPQQDKMK